MGAVDTPCDPLLEQEALEIVGVFAQVERRGLQRHQVAARLVPCEMNVAAAAAVDRAQDLEAVEHHPRLQHRRQRQLGGVTMDLDRLGIRQRVDAHQLQGQVVVAAGLEGGVDDGRGQSVQIRFVAAQQLGELLWFEGFVDPVGGQHEQVIHLDRQHVVVEIQVTIDAEGSRQVGLFAGHHDAMVVGKQFELLTTQAVDAPVADVEEVGRCGLQHQRTEGADVAAVALVLVGAAAGLGV